MTIGTFFPGYRCFLRGTNPVAISTLHSNDVIISEEVCTQPSPPPPASHIITAQVEASTLTRAQYNTIATLMCSLLYLPTGALKYDGYTLHPLTLHWHCAAEELQENILDNSTGFLRAMRREGIKKVSIKEKEFCIPQMRVSLMLVIQQVLSLISLC